MSRIGTAVLLCALLALAPVVTAQEAPRADLYMDPFVITSLGTTEDGQCAIKIRFTVRNKGASIDKARLILDLGIKNVAYNASAVVALPSGIVYTYDQHVTVPVGTFNVQSIVNGHTVDANGNSVSFLPEVSLANNSRSGPGVCSASAR